MRLTHGKFGTPVFSCGGRARVLEFGEGAIVAAHQARFGALKRLPDLFLAAHPKLLE